MVFDWFQGLMVLVSASLSAVIGLWMLTLWLERSRPAIVDLGHEGPAAAVFVFDGDLMIDASPAGRALLAAAPSGGTPHQRLMAFLSLRFPGVEARLDALEDEGRIVLDGAPRDDGPAVSLIAEWSAGLTHLILRDAETASAPDPLLQRAMEEELALLRRTVNQAPLPIWLENAAGDVVWANSGYLGLATQLLGPERDFSWPLPRLLKVAGNDRQRVRAGASRWFEAHVHPAEGGRLVFAQPIDALTEAEAALRDFTQTLTKTFAHLPIGLAIFDRGRQLALFNPALLELTGLPADFLASRPLLFQMLDRMRDRQMIPEPRDYIGWRSRMIDLEKQAAAGLYLETWNLPGGQTYRVMARPHPDGALAMLFEDISTETSRTRRFRADLELGQSVVDAMDEAVAVFSAAGALVMTNAAYTDLWGHDPGGSLSVDTGIGAMADYWRSRSAPTALWAEAEDFVASLTRRTSHRGEARLTDGRLVSCRCETLSGGATLIAFRVKRGDEGPLLIPVARDALTPA